MPNRNGCFYTILFSVLLWIMIALAGLAAMGGFS